MEAGISAHHTSLVCDSCPTLHRGEETGVVVGSTSTEFDGRGVPLRLVLGPKCPILRGVCACYAHL